MSSDLQQRCSNLVERLGLAKAADVQSVTPLTGGVASDIAVVELSDRTICAKFALEQLRVAQEWCAPLGRNAAEYAWLQFAGSTVPGSAPSLLGRDSDEHGFAMEYIRGEDIYLWKSALLERQPVRGEAAKVGRALGAIHSASACADFDTSLFQNQADFRKLRIEPYLEFTASIHPSLAERMAEIIADLESNSVALIHGDVSPKNILFRAGQPVILDAECATMGDPSFDVAFCINHLILKAFHMPDRADRLLSEAQEFWNSYKAKVSWEEVESLEARVCQVLPALMLARIDGKSPVEYLTDTSQARVRDVSRKMILKPPQTLKSLFLAVNQKIEGRTCG